MKSETPSTLSIWLLVGRFGDGGGPRRIPISTTPFRVGRQPNLALTLPSPTVSSEHAEFVEHRGQLVVHDLGSTNGTYVNGKRIREQTVVDSGDIVQFANLAFRLDREVIASNARTLGEEACDTAIGLIQFDKLFSQRLITPYFQPIVDLRTTATVGYEALARSPLFGLRNPKEMFDVALQLDLERDLSRLLREEEVRGCSGMPDELLLFLNTHPGEIRDSELTPSLRVLRGMEPRQPLILELHEAAVGSRHSMLELKSTLRDLDIGLAYDDFGAGQSRLLELIEVPPDYLKFDITLVRGIHLDTGHRRRMVGQLVQMVREMGIVPLAEGIESREEGEVCAELGFELAQGFYYGRPMPLKRPETPAIQA